MGHIADLGPIILGPGEPATLSATIRDRGSGRSPMIPDRFCGRFLQAFTPSPTHNSL